MRNARNEFVSGEQESRLGNASLFANAGIANSCNFPVMRVETRKSVREGKAKIAIADRE